MGDSFGSPPPRYLSKFLPAPSRGFTLVEMVVVLVIIGVLAVIGMPQFFNTTTFQEWGFSDEVRAAFRYANKIAIASGCDTQVITTSNSYTVTQRVSCSSGLFTQPVNIPGGSGSGYTGTAPGGVALSALSIYFDSQGRPRNSSDDSLVTTATSVTVGSRSLTIEPQTGYMH